MHPHDAAERGITDGDDVRVFNDRGQFVALAKVTDDIAAGVLMAPMGAWRKNAKGHSTVNAVNPFAFADLGNAPTFSDTRVEVARLRGSAADSGHRPGGLQETGVVNAVAGQLDRDRRVHCSAISSSLAPARSGVRRSDSVRANRQLRIWPSAVSRTRSQAPQNGRVTEAITPTLAGPPLTRKVSAGAATGRARSSGVRV